MKLNLEKLKNNAATPLIILDLLMVLIAVINLNWIVFDWLFSFPEIQNIFSHTLPRFGAFYLKEIHEDFYHYDLIFVGIFLSELSFRWITAIFQKTYPRWFFYPFIHWYDVLGCIPIGSFRFLRVLRIISIIYRLQKLNIIDIRNNIFYETFDRYLNIVVEEISDRVVVSVLDGVQKEVSGGHPIVQKINIDVIQPQKDQLLMWMDLEFSSAIQQAFYSNENNIKNYLTNIIAINLGAVSEEEITKYGQNNEQVYNSAELKTTFLKKPLFNVSKRLAHGAVFDALSSFIDDIGNPDKPRIQALVNQIGESLKDQQLEPLSELLTDTVVQIIEKIKEEVGVRQWQVAEAQAKAEINTKT